MPKSNPVTPNKQPPEDWNDLLTEFLHKAGRGLQKTFIRKLWAVEEDIISNTNPSTLRMMFCSPAMFICSEGIQLGAEILFKIGIGNGLTLLEKQITKNELTDLECQRYGDVFKTAWKNAHEESNFDLTEELETDVFMRFVQYALYAHKPTCLKFQKILVSFAHEKKVDRNLGEMITKILNGCIYQALDAVNPIVKASAAEVFFMFFPFVEHDPEDMDSSVEKQLGYMRDLITTDIVSLRTEAVKRSLKCFSEFWLVLPKHIVKEISSLIIDNLTRDSVVGVRVAVFEGLLEIAYSPACLSVYQNGMKCATVPGVQDKSERVRLAAYQALHRLKNHKFISIFEMIDRDDVIATMELENVEDCRQQLIPIMHVILPISENMDEKYYRPRVDYLLGKSRIALLTYFRLLGPMKIIEPLQAAKLIEMLITWAYRYLRRKEGPPLPETEDKYKKARVYLECALILYMSCKKMLLFNCDLKIKGRCDQLFGKVVKEIFEKYANTPILGTATAISSVIPKDNLKTIASDVLGRLANDEVPPEAVEPFLESALHFNPDSVFDSISNGLDVFTDLYGEKQKQSKRKKRDVGDPEETLTTSLNRLKYIIQSYSTSSLLATDEMYKIKLMELTKKIDLVREAIEVRLVKSDNDEHALRDETLLTALEFRFILPLYAVSENHDDENDRNNLISSTKTLLNWFQDNIAAKMSEFEEHNYEFLIKLSVTFLNCLNISLSAYDFKTVPLEYEDEEDKENQSQEKEEEEEEQDKSTVGEIACRIVKSFGNSATPFEIFSPALRVGTILCEDSYSETHDSMAGILRFVPKWMNKQFELEDEEEDTSEQDREAIETLRLFHKKVSETDSWDENMSTRMMSHFVVFTFMTISSNHDEEEYADPRREDYKPNRFISLALLRFILKEKTLTDDFFSQISNNYLPENSKYFTEADGETATSSKLSKLAVLSVLLRILEKYSKSHKNLIKEGIQTCTTRVLDCFANATDLNTVESHIMNSLCSVLDVELPDGF